MAVASCSHSSGTGTGSGQPNSAVTAPADPGRPPAPVSADEARAGEPLVPYAQIGLFAQNSLAPNEAPGDLIAACLQKAGYLNISGAELDAQKGETAETAPVAGPFGFIGLSAAEQYGFRNGRQALIVPAPSSGTAQGAARLRCEQQAQDFQTKYEVPANQFVARIGLSAISYTAANPHVQAAVAAWSSCMKAQGFDYSDPGTLEHQIDSAIQPPSNQGAIAVIDARCTQSTDLAGIYYTVLDDYQRQLLATNTQQLDAYVKQFRSGYQKTVAGFSAAAG